MTMTLTAQIAAAVSARKGSLVSLRARMWELLADLPVGVRLSDDAGEVLRIIRIESDAHQGEGWPVTVNRGIGAVADGRLIADDGDIRYRHDGSNSRHAFGSPRLRNDGADLPYTTGAATREIARRLPVALARYFAECEAERAANDATLTA